jgi:hypothetical protein
MLHLEDRKGRVIVDSKGQKTEKVKKDGTPYKKNPYQEFVKENYSRIRDSSPLRLTASQVMKELGSQWKARKSESKNEIN